MHEAQPAILRRHARALRILTCLQSGAGYNAADLSQQFNVSRRTIFRDISMIREAGVPVYFDEKSETYQLAARAQQITPPQFSEEDLRCLVLSSQLSLLQSFPDYANRIRETVSKLLAVHPSHCRQAASRLLRACVVRVPRVSAVSMDIVKAIFQAIGRQQQIRILVENPAEDAQPGQVAPAWTKFSPYRFVISDDRWAVVGRSSIHRRNKTFAVQQIHNVEFTNESFAVPRGFHSRP